jgi:membrane-bound metal-dependent hydrolase YbcI (DUF457 family)
MTLLAFAPLAYVLVSDGKLTLAVLCWLGIQTIEPLPDQDFRLQVLDHRGASHSLLAVLVVGSVLGAGGWLLGDRLFDVLYGVFSTGGHLWSRLLAVLPDTSAYVLSGLAPSITPGEIVATIQEQTGGSVARRGFAIFGFFVGSFGVIAHLLGDVITTQGIKPFVPLSGWRLSLSSLRADSPVANSGLFGLGVLAIVVVLVATVPGAVLGAGMPAALSPVDVAAGQSTTQTTNQTTTQTQNASSANATVTFSNQTTNGSTVRVKSATLPDGGFVVLTNDPYSEIGLLEESIIAVKPLSPGTHRNITLRVKRSPPGGFVNRTTLDTTSDYAVGLHRDTNNNSRFEYITSAGTNDTAYLTGTGTEKRYVSDAATITVPGANTPTRTASIRFRNQTTNGSAVTIQSVTLPNGGFVVIHNESYLHGGDPVQTAIGLSQHLPAGTHRNVSVMLSQPVQQSQTLVAIPSRDTNGNQRYDYVRSGGFQDPAYTGNGTIITDTASVTSAGTPSASAAPPSTTPSTAASTPARSGTAQPTTDTATGGEGGVGAWASSNLLGVGVVVLVVLVVLPTLLRRV